MACMVWLCFLQNKEEINAIKNIKTDTARELDTLYFMKIVRIIFILFYFIITIIINIIFILKSFLGWLKNKVKKNTRSREHNE